MNTSRPQDETSSSYFSYESALPLSNGKLATLLFISTEVMLFTAILASYIVLRYSGTQHWPTAQEVQLNPILGLLNTTILLLSGVTMWWSVHQCAAGKVSVSKFWLWATIGLGIAFLAVKFMEYRTKYEHGIFPNPGRRLIYDLPDENYLSRVVLAMREEVRRLERASAGSDTAGKQQRLDDLYLLQAGIVDWTQFMVGKTADPAWKRQAISALARQIYDPGDGRKVDEFVESENNSVGEEKVRLASQLQRVSDIRIDAQNRLRELLPKKDSGDPAMSREYDRVSATVRRLTDQVTEINKQLLPIENRLQAMEIVASGPGINEKYGLRLPIVIAGGHQWCSLYYLLTGTHAIHLIAGLFALLFLACCRLSVGWQGVLENVGLYWHFVDVVWLVVFAVIYLI